MTSGGIGQERRSDTRLSPDVAAARAERQLDLGADPDCGGHVSGGSLQEAHVIMSLVEAGELRPPLTRSAGHGDCTDANRQDWDVKSPRDGDVRPPFDVGFFVEAHIRSQVRCDENVIVDLSGLSDPSNRRALREAVTEAGLAAHVRWFE
jgi:hypothetical protein